MLKTRVFTLCVLTDDAEVNIVMASLITGDVLDEHDRSEDIEFLSKGDVEGLVARPLNWGEENTLQAKLVSSKRSN